MTAVLHYAEWRGQLVKFRHAIGARALKANDHDDVLVELACLESLQHLVLVGEAAGGSLD